MGVIQSCGGYLCYFLVFDEFGFTPGILNRLVLKPYFHHNKGDIYDPTSPTLGNSNIRCNGGDLELIDDFGNTSLEKDNLKGNMLDWMFTNDLE